MGDGRLEVFGRLANKISDAPISKLLNGQQKDRLREKLTTEFVDDTTLAFGDPATKALYTEAWRGLWRLVNLLQGVRGLHVALSGLDTLSPPDVTSGGGPKNADSAAWTEARALCDKVFYPLIDALVAAELPGPDHIGDDVVADGRLSARWNSAGRKLWLA